MCDGYNRGVARATGLAARDEAGRRLTEMGADARPALVEAMRASDPEIRLRARQLILRLPWALPGDPPGVQALLSDYGSKPENDRDVVARNLAGLANGAAVPAMLRLLAEEPSELNRWSIARLLRGKTSGLLMALLGGDLLHRGVTGHCYLYGALGIDTTTHKPTTAVPAQQGYKFETRLAIQRPPEDLFRFWRKLENQPTIMEHLVSVTPAEAGRSRWVAKGPWGSVLEWDAEIYRERENELIAWRSLVGSQVDTAGSVHFERLPDGQGTMLRLSLKYNPPAGKVGASLASFFGQGLENELQQDLGRFKQIMEAGERPET
jgi:uncharacterized membrane protein